MLKFSCAPLPYQQKLIMNEIQIVDRKISYLDTNLVVFFIMTSAPGRQETPKPPSGGFLLRYRYEEKNMLTPIACNLGRNLHELLCRVGSQ